jgi:hypothetical protein
MKFYPLINAYKAFNITKRRSQAEVMTDEAAHSEHEILD